MKIGKTGHQHEKCHTRCDKQNARATHTHSISRQGALKGVAQPGIDRALLSKALLAPVGQQRTNTRTSATKWNMRAQRKVRYGAWCPIGNDLPGFGNEPFGVSLKGNHSGNQFLIVASKPHAVFDTWPAGHPPDRRMANKWMPSTGIWRSETPESLARLIGGSSPSRCSDWLGWEFEGRSRLGQLPTRMDVQPT